MRNKLFPVFSIFLFIFVYSQNIEELNVKHPNKLENDKKIYSDNDVKFFYPSDWILEVNELSSEVDKESLINKKRVSVFVPNPGFKSFVIGISIEPYFYNKKNDKFVKGIIKEIRSYIDSEIRLKRRIVKDKLDCQDIIYKWKDNMDQVYFFQNWERYIQVNKSRICKVVFFCTDKDFNTHYSLVKEILESLEIKRI